MTTEVILRELPDPRGSGRPLTPPLDLSVTTQGPLYPPSEVMDAQGNFIVIGALNEEGPAGVTTRWGGAIVSPRTSVPQFGQRAPYTIVERFEPKEPLPDAVATKVLYTLPVPLPCNNYTMLFAPQQYPDARSETRPSYAFHEVPIPDARPEHGRQLTGPVTLADWMRARGSVQLFDMNNGCDVLFRCDFSGLLPRSLYTVMTLRAHDLDPAGPTRPGPLGIPNSFVTDGAGSARFEAVLPDPFPDPALPEGNRVINLVVLWMSSQLCHGGAIGRYGLGGDIHAQLKFPQPMFEDLRTRSQFA